MKKIGNGIKWIFCGRYGLRIGSILAILLIILLGGMSAAIYSDYVITRHNCHTFGKENHTLVRVSFTYDCRVLQDGNWVPTDNYIVNRQVKK